MVNLTALIRKITVIANAKLRDFTVEYAAIKPRAKMILLRKLVITRVV